MITALVFVKEKIETYKVPSTRQIDCLPHEGKSPSLSYIPAHFYDILLSNHSTCTCWYHKIVVRWATNFELILRARHKFEQAKACYSHYFWLALAFGFALERHTHITWQLYHHIFIFLIQNTNIISCTESAASNRNALALRWQLSHQLFWSCVIQKHSADCRPSNSIDLDVLHLL